MYSTGMWESLGMGHGAQTFSQVASRLAIHGNTNKAKVAADLYGHLSLILDH